MDTPVALADDRRWLQVMHQLEADIAAGRLPAGSRLASERLLGERLAVSRDTLRRALLALADAGSLEPAPRRGWFVARPPVREALAAPQGLTEWGALNGRAIGARVLGSRVRPATPDEAEALRVAPGEDVFELERVRLIDGEPLSLDRSRLPLARAPFLPEVDFAGASLYATLADRAGIVPARAEYEVSAGLADAATAQVLTIAPGAPILCVREIAFDADGRAFELLDAANRGDRYRYRTTLLRPA
jgi:GntR family transcriptional regulator